MLRNKDKLLIDKISNYLDENKIEYENHDLIRNVIARKKGKRFSFEDGIKSLVYSLLSNQKKWKDIRPKLKEIDELFFYYNKNKILSESSDYFYNGIKKLKCGNISTKKQMVSLAYDIHMLEKIEDEYGSLEKFFDSFSIYEIVDMIAEGKYKLKYVGKALAWEFLRNMGIDGAKPDLHMRRILGSDRLGYSDSSIASVTEVVRIFDDIANNTGYFKAYLDTILWHYCADGYGEICTAKPKCNKCVIREFCNYPSIVE